MTATTRDIVLGDRTFAVPVLSIRHNRIIYPLCRDLSESEGDDTFFARLIAKTGTPDAVRDDEWPKLEKIAFHAACAADKDMTQDAFDDMPITPPQLIDAFFVIRIQTGAWRSPEEIAADPASADKAAAGDAPQGEDLAA